MNKSQAIKLARLADHLENGKLGHKRFDFSVFNLGHEEGNTCGMAGCALGEMPVVFPRTWIFDDVDGDPVLKNPKQETDYPHSPLPLEHAKQFFGLDEYEVYHLFMPEKQEPQIYGGRKLGDHATRKSVAKNIWSFLGYKGWNINDLVKELKPK